MIQLIFDKTDDLSLAKCVELQQLVLPDINSLIKRKLISHPEIPVVKFVP